MTPDELAGAVNAEKSLLVPAVRRDPDALSRLFADDFSEIGKNGRMWSRAEVLDSLAGEGILESLTGNGAPMPTDEWEARQVAQDLVLVTYVSDVLERRVRRSSLWRRGEAGWQAVFHQGTQIV